MGPISRTTQLERLLSFTKRLLWEEEPSRLPELALHAIVEFTAADQGFLLLREPSGRPRVRAAHNLDRETMRGERFRPYRKIADYVLTEGEAFLTPSAADDERLSAAESLHDLPRGVLAFPLRSRDLVIGAVYVDKFHHATPFTVDELRLAQEFGGIIAAVLDSRHLIRHLRRRDDELTQVNASLEVMASHLKEDVAAKSVEIAEFERELDSKNRALAGRYNFGKIVGQSPQMRQICGVLNQVAEYPVPVLLTGEPGTGKSLIARTLHHQGPNPTAPFLSVDCAALSGPLLERALFGQADARTTSQPGLAGQDGLLVCALDGTIFLSGIDQMPLTVQIRLLEILEGKSVGVGPVRARIVTASTRELSALAADGQFDERLYRRLNTVEVPIPPLRARVEDIPPLVEHFFDRFSEVFGLPRKRLSSEALNQVTRMPWPGNAQQLEQVLKSAAVLSAGTLVLVTDLRLDPQTPIAPVPLSLADEPSASILTRTDWEAHEKQQILDALVKCGWNKTRAAVFLDISRRNLYRKLARYGIEGE